MNTLVCNTLATALFAGALLLPNGSDADVPQNVLTDPYVTSIDGFELYGNGLYWWRQGTSGLGGSPGGVAYNAFTGTTRLGITPSSLNRLTGGFRHGGSIIDELFFAGPVGGGHYLVRNSTDCGREALRDEAFGYYVREGTLRRKGLHRGPSDSDEEILRFKSDGPPFVAPVVADGASFLDNGWLYYWDSNGTTTSISRVNLDGIQPTENIAVFPGSGLRKVLVTAVLAPDGAVTGRYLFALTTDRNLYRMLFQTGTTPFLVASGISDFTARDEKKISTHFSRLSDDVTRIYASTYSLSGTTNGLVWSINGLSLDQAVAYDSGSPLIQIRSVTCDLERMFLSTALLTSNPPLGVSDTGTGNLLRRVWNTDFRANTGPWETVAFETGNNLRSTGTWVYFQNGNSIRKLRTDAPAVQLSLTALGMEVVQVVQDMHNTIPLVAGKATTVRGYARVSANTTGYLGPYFYPTAQVAVWDGLQKLGTLRAFNRPRVGPENHLGNLLLWIR